MPRPANRTRSRRRVYIKTPGGLITIHYRARKPSVAKCSICGKPLGGVPRLRPVELKKLAKTEKRPERIYGGVVCSSCLTKLLRESARSIQIPVSKQ